MSQTPNINIVITDTSDNAISMLSFSPIPGTPTVAVPLRIRNAESSQGTSANILTAIRCDLLLTAPAVEETFESNANGQELVDEMWLEIESNPGSWTPLAESPIDKDYYDFGAIAAGNHIDFNIRLNVAADCETISECNFCLALRSRP